MTTSATAATKPALLARSIILPPRQGSQHKSTVIFCHGLGDENRSFVSLFEEMQSSALQSTRFVLPNAKIMPVTVNGGMKCRSWYDLVSFDRSHGLAIKEDESGIQSSRAEIEALLDYEAKLLTQAKQPSEDSASATPAASNQRVPIVLGGFSQGAAMSLLTGLSSEHRLAGIVVASGYLLLHTKIADLINPEKKSLPIFAYHGADDEIVPLKSYAEEGVKILAQHGIQVKLNVEPHLPHAMSQDEIEMIQSFIVSQFKSLNAL